MHRLHARLTHLATANDSQVLPSPGSRSKSPPRRASYNHRSSSTPPSTRASALSSGTRCPRTSSQTARPKRHAHPQTPARARALGHPASSPRPPLRLPCQTGPFSTLGPSPNTSSPKSRFTAVSSRFSPPARGATRMNRRGTELWVSPMS